MFVFHPLDRKMRNAQVLPVVVGITLCTASAALFYKWYKTRNSSQDAVDGGPRKRKPKQPSKVEMMIETDMMPLVLGRNGNNIKSIEERHSVKITFREKDKEKQVCEISGLYENMMKASTAISDEVKKGRSLTEEIVIPKTTCTRISSQILRDICRETATQIRNKGGLKDKNLRQLEITGAFMNVQKAKRMIEEQVREDSMHREHETKREPRYNQKNSPINSSMESLSKQSCNSD